MKPGDWIWTPQVMGVWKTKSGKFGSLVKILEILEKDTLGNLKGPVALVEYGPWMDRAYVELQKCKPTRYVCSKCGAKQKPCCGCHVGYESVIIE